MQRSFVVLALALAPVAGLAQVPAQQAAQTSDARRADSLYQQRAFRAAAAAYRVVVERAPGDGRSWYRLGVSLSSLNENAQAADAFERSVAIGHQVLAIYNAAAMRARLGDADRALAWLDTALARGFTGDSILRQDPDFAALRTDARFRRIVGAAERAFRPCVSRPESHQFDFWIGEWDVTSVQGQPAGKSSVQQILSQCVIFENWTDGQGGQGKSFNAYNAPLGVWQQFWTDQYGRVTEYRESERTAENGLRFTARQVLPQGKALIRMTFTPIDKNTVRQFGEQSFDDGKSWQTRFDLYYHRRG